MEEKEFRYKCRCGAVYKIQGTEDEVEKYLDSQTWMCEAGRHSELGKKRDYLTLIEVNDELTPKPEIEPKTHEEYTIPELQEKFGTSLAHVGFGIFKDPDGGIWDYRSGPEGEKLYSKK